MEKKTYKTCNYVLNINDKKYECVSESEYIATDQIDFFDQIIEKFQNYLCECVKSGNYSKLFFHYDCEFNSDYTLIESDDLSVNGKNLKSVIWKKNMEIIKTFFDLIGDVYVYTTRKDLFDEKEMNYQKTRHSLRGEISDSESIFITRVVDENITIPSKYDKFCRMNSDFEVIELLSE